MAMMMTTTACVVSIIFTAVREVVDLIVVGPPLGSTTAPLAVVLLDGRRTIVVHRSEALGAVYVVLIIIFIIRLEVFVATVALVTTAVVRG